MRSSDIIALSQGLTFDGSDSEASGSNRSLVVTSVSVFTAGSSSSDSSSDKIGACTNLRLLDEIAPVDVISSPDCGVEGARAFRPLGLGGSFVGFGTDGTNFGCIVCRAICFISATVYDELGRDPGR
ncbi:unnamed protein product [Phytophthora fragariaefolia]|uniref:Unnamed protein product n=1 Tax=Phytophthora fragariaefolia TaxID=1490495 RepID=A0A9W6UB01_9STRA|nr:unnamed protein product [Phytophthora fragariaefolia]